jgi:hypothetical protein
MQETVNIHETNGGSVTVGLPDFRFEAMRRQLIALRVSVGANTPRGHAASNLVEQLDAFQTATGFQRENLAKLIPYQMARLGGNQ